MGRHKDKLIEQEEGREAAARARGRVCKMCGETIDFDDVFAEGSGLCSSCRYKLNKDD